MHRRGRDLGPPLRYRGALEPRRFPIQWYQGYYSAECTPGYERTEVDWRYFSNSIEKKENEHDIRHSFSSLSTPCFPPNLSRGASRRTRPKNMSNSESRRSFSTGSPKAYKCNKRDNLHGPMHLSLPACMHQLQIHTFHKDTGYLFMRAKERRDHQKQAIHPCSG